MSTTHLDFKNEWIYNSTPLIRLHRLDRNVSQHGFKHILYDLTYHLLFYIYFNIFIKLNFMSWLLCCLGLSSCVLLFVCLLLPLYVTVFRAGPRGGTVGQMPGALRCYWKNHEQGANKLRFSHVKEFL